LISDYLYIYISNHLLTVCDEKLLNKTKAVVRLKPVTMKRLLATELERKFN
jgi:hypothetical protein